MFYRLGKKKKLRKTSEGCVSYPPSQVYVGRLIFKQLQRHLRADVSKYQPEVRYSEKYIIIHILRGDFLSLNESVIFWRFFIIFNILNVSFDEKLANFKAQNRQLIVYHVKERYLFFQNLFSN